ncbi:MAG: 30S ribosomal protein S17 [Chlamydiia bacterium]|nr:30S ribosomal protein S17 [Chlamydiota bacterium]
MEQVVIKNARKVKEGVVVSNKMQKTVTVKVERTLRHQHFGKVITRAKKYYAHAENSQDIPEGQKVRIVETRPLSKLKRWRVVELLV